jgi:hypothetical protein
MRRLLLIVVAVAAAAFAISYGLRRLAQTPHAAVTTLLPKETIALVHLPDLNRTRDQWHESDIYRIYREPAVQDFLRRPLQKLKQNGQASQTLREVEQLEPKDGFVALISIDNKNPKLVGGFHFRGSQADAEKIVGKWIGRLVPNAGQHENVQYEKHTIDIVGAAPNQVATVYDGDWFFLSNDLAELKTLLDRADGRTKDPKATLNEDETFRAAMAHMPPSYTLLFYLRPAVFAKKLATLRPGNEPQLLANQRTILEQMHSLCATTRFENGKIHDVFFVGMPNLNSNATLTRSSLELGTKDTFLYLATLLNVEKFAALDQPGVGPLASGLKKLFDAAARNGVTVEDWKAAFQLELGSLGDWPERSRWPSLVATLPVKDPARANKIVDTLTSAVDEDVAWTKTEKDGIHYFYMPTPGNLLAITPTIGLSDRLLIAGFDSASVEAAMKRSLKPAGELDNSSVYQSAAHALPSPTRFFTYVDLALLYSRLDTALRPMLVMSAAFMPAISSNIDVSKLPPPEVITKHLSPIVASQRYDTDGYVAESIGPITLGQATIVAALPVVLWFGAHHPVH